MCCSNELIYFILYLIGFLFTLKLFNIQVYRLYKESKSNSNYKEWSQDTEWEGIPFLLIFGWPLALIILIIINIIQYIKYIRDNRRINK